MSREIEGLQIRGKKKHQIVSLYESTSMDPARSQPGSTRPVTLRGIEIL